jgi:hypothetical protein
VRKPDRPLKVEVAYTPCSPQEWDEALDLLAGIIAEAYLDGRLEKYRERSQYQARSQYEEPHPYKTRRGDRYVE